MQIRAGPGYRRQTRARARATLFPYRYGLSLSFAAHLFKAVAKQHHREQLPILRPLIPRTGVVVDVGGHAGQYAKLFARLAPQGHVYTFEPGAYPLAILRAAVRLNRLCNITIVPQGLGAAPGAARLKSPVKHHRTLGFGLAHLGPDHGGRELHEEEIVLTTLDAFVAARGLERLDFLKADVEGWELRVLTGAEATLRRFRPPLLLELYDQLLARAGDDLASAWTFLGGLGYRPHSEAASDRLAPIDAPREGDIWWLPS